jgi:hypothetical protein
MTNIHKAEQTAIAQIEQAFIDAGWSDGWGLTDEEVRSAPSPLFYRNATPTTATEARATIDGQTHCLYAIYNIIDNAPKYAENKPTTTDVTVNLTFYYDDPSLLDSGAFATFVEALIDELADGLWTLSGEGESAVAATDDGSPYMHRKIIFATNNF